MATAVRLVAALGSLLLANEAAFAQTPIAPPPHLALNELLKEKQRCGLSLRLWDARLLGCDAVTALSQVRETAWGFWRSKLTERQSDRNEAYLRLSYLAKVEPTLVTLRTERLLLDLNATLLPRKSKPGSVEALIDELTDSWDDPDNFDSEVGYRALNKLIDLGFDAVPALIEHIEDTRLTRSSGRTILELDSRIVRVGDLVSGLLDSLADGAVGEEDAWWFYGTFASPKAARKWWENAQRVGEEEWLLAHAMPAKDYEGRDVVTPTNGLILRVLGVRYPHRLPALYQTILLKRRSVDSEKIANVIASSKLPHEQKLSLLEAGASHTDYFHRYAALKGLRGVAMMVFQRHLLHALEQFPIQIARSGFTGSELRVAGLIGLTDDRKCWDALTAATRRASVELRFEIIERAGSADPRDESAAIQREHIRYLLGFLDDSSVAAPSGRSVRDFTLVQLAYALGIGGWQQIRLPPGPREISLLRERVRELAERELARPAK